MPGWIGSFYFFGHDGNTPLHSRFVQLFACGCSIVMALLPFLGLMLISCFSLLLVGIGTSLLVICILHILFNYLRTSRSPSDCMRIRSTDRLLQMANLK
jgi:hypothetical protein